MNKILLKVALVILATAIFHPAHATEPEPGDSCAGFTENSVMRSGGPELGGAYHTMKCVSGLWEAIDGGSGGGGGGDTTPEAFSFTDQTGTNLDEVITSNAVTISGIDSSAFVTVSAAAGAPQIRINGGSWVSSGNISNGQTLEVRITSANASTTARTATVEVGGVSDVWSVTTAVSDTTPDNFTFTDQNGVNPNQEVLSNIVTISGVNAPLNFSCNINDDGECRINGGAWSNGGGPLRNGDTVQLRIVTSASFDTSHLQRVGAGSANDNWYVNTGPQDSVPDAFSFTDLTDQALNTVVTSNTVTISGINASTLILLSGTGSPQLSINGGAWATSGFITNGQSLQVRLTSANAAGTARTATVSIGGVSDVWSVTTAASTNKIVFITSTAYNGNLGGIAGADAKCTTRASAASLPGTYKAWISTSASDDPESRFTQHTGNYIRTGDGVVVANGWADLTDGTLDARIAKNEFGAEVADAYPWTSVLPNGQSSAASHGSCANWTDGSFFQTGGYGENYSTNSLWTDSEDEENCNSSSYRLYCFQQ